MKRWILLFLLSPIFLNLNVFADVTNSKNNTEVRLTKAQKKAQVKILSARLEEIHRLATSTQLSVMEKKQMREEVLTIKQQLEKMEGVYLYLSLTAILIIILLILLI
jgi:hypothetical protein